MFEHALYVKSLVVFEVTLYERLLNVNVFVLRVAFEYACHVVCTGVLCERFFCWDDTSPVTTLFTTLVGG